ncbi:MAG: hypothetical protein AAB316_23715 [Bacteroidota bacterium]
MLGKRYQNGRKDFQIRRRGSAKMEGWLVQKTGQLLVKILLDFQPAGTLPLALA